jgi:hypothetical protein
MRSVFSFCRQRELSLKFDIHLVVMEAVASPNEIVWCLTMSREMRFQRTVSRSYFYVLSDVLNSKLSMTTRFDHI